MWLLFLVEGDAKNYRQREMFLSNLQHLDIDVNKNKEIYDKFGIISFETSKFQIYFVPSNEELEIAKQSKQLICEKGE